MKIALPCPGLDHVQRGFETYTRELFDALRDLCDVQLVKSSGDQEPRAQIVPAWRRTSPLHAILPARWRTEYRRLELECWTFALGMIPLLRREKFDIIHFSEAPLGDALKWLRRRFGFSYRLLLSNGGPCPPWDCARFDAVHEVSPVHQTAGINFGQPEDRSFLVPYGTSAARLRPPPTEDRKSIRRHFDLPPDAFVVLSLAALNCYHKRIDWLIQEFAKLPAASSFLVLAGNRELETEQLETLAAKLLPARNFRFVQLPYTEVPPLLRASDVMVLCSLDEGFGRVYTEAMGAKVPLLSHPHPTARWIIDNSDCLVDMTTPGLLASKLNELSQNTVLNQKIAEHNFTTFRRFDWSVLAPDYLRMYEKVSLLDPRKASAMALSP